MTAGSRSLVEAGFLSKSGKEKFGKLKGDELRSALDKASPDELEAAADHHELEVVKDQIVKTDYPKPVNSYQVLYEAFNNPIEPIYFWSLGFMENDLGCPKIDKITDLFTASEQSSFYGAAAQRLGLAQDKVSQFLATIGQLIKRDLFQLVRDIRWLNERLDIHEASRKEKGFEPSETALKGIWVDLVDGVVQGQRVAQNIWGMASQLQFTTLPTLFFNTHIRPKSKDVQTKGVEAAVTEAIKSEDFLGSEIKKQVGAVSPNREIMSVLYRKFVEYMTWRERNYEELRTRKRFELNYLRQHWQILNMYLNWLRPYLRHIERMTEQMTHLEKPELIGAFEGNLIEIEIIGRKLPDKNKSIFGCLLMSFEYRTRPSLPFQVEAGFHRGPLHVGQAKIFWRGYAWSDEDIERFKRARQRKDLELLGKIDKDVEATMRAMGADLEKFLREAGWEEAGSKKEGEKKEEKKGESILEPFTAILSGFKSLFWEPFFPASEKKTEKKDDGSERGAAEKTAKQMAWVHYKLFKKAHGFVAW